jgi:hypothetical protein
MGKCVAIVQKHIHIYAGTLYSNVLALEFVIKFKLLKTLCRVEGNNVRQNRAMAQAVSRLHLTAVARVRSSVSPGGICCGQSGTGTGTSVFPCQFHSTGAPLHGK